MFINLRKVISFIIVLSFGNLYCKKFNFLENFEYLSNNLCKSLNLKFNENPICLSEPKLDKGKIDFFLPLTLVKNNKLIKLNEINRNNGIIFKFELVDKPLNGLKIYLVYDEAKYNLRLDRFDQTLSFKFYDKDFLKQLTENEISKYFCA